jgi:hypothetical protein
MLNVNEHMSRGGGMLDVMIAAMAHTESAAGTSLLRNRTGGVAPLSGGFVAATDLGLDPPAHANLGLSVGTPVGRARQAVHDP